MRGDVVIVRGDHSSGLQLRLRISGALLLAVSAGIHLDLYLTGYRKIPTIGWLFLLQVIVGFMLTIAALVTRGRLAAAASAALALSTLGAYLLAVWIGLFGFEEIRTRAGTPWSHRVGDLRHAGARRGPADPCGTPSAPGAGPGRKRGVARRRRRQRQSRSPPGLLGVTVVSARRDTGHRRRRRATLKTAAIGGVDVSPNADASPCTGSPPTPRRAPVHRVMHRLLAPVAGARAPASPAGSHRRTPRRRPAGHLRRPPAAIPLSGTAGPTRPTATSSTSTATLVRRPRLPVTRSRPRRDPARARVRRPG